MTRKKTNLWLHKAKKHNQIKLVIKTPNSKTFSPRISTASPARESWKRFVTPLKGKSPKRQRIFSPLDVGSATDDGCVFIPSLSPFKGNGTHNSSYMSFSNKSSNDNGLYSVVIQKLREKGFEKDFLAFLELVEKDKFPFDNLSFKLFLETVRFLSLKRKTDMTYSNDTKRFWKIGYRLYFMSGPRHINRIVEQSTEDMYTDINFAVPTLSTLHDFAVSDFQIPTVTDQGPIYPVLDTLSSLDSQEYMLCADGKKVTSGIDSRGGEVDMFGFEDGISLIDKKKKMEEDRECIKNIAKCIEKYDNGTKLADIEPDDKFKLNGSIKVGVALVCSRLKESRELALRQEFGVNKFKAMAGSSWRESKYVYVISGLQASLFQLREFKSETLALVNEMLRISSCVFKPVSDFVVSRDVDNSYQKNMITLPENQTFDLSSTQFIKQRSDEWLEIRKKARITGSTLHSAIGLRGLKEQKRHFSIFINGQKEDNFSDEVQKRMDYGTKHEIDAIATLVGKILPAFFPKYSYVEEGCYVIPGSNTDILGIVSPDGSVRHLGDPETNGTEPVVAAMEIKCPFPSEKSMPVHYKLPEYYVCQCLAEMFVLKTNLLLYISYSECSSTILKVDFSQELWNMILEEVKRLYDQEYLMRPIKSNPKVKDIKAKIKEFVENNVQLLCEVPSCNMIDSGLRTAVEGSPFLHAWQRSLPSRAMVSVTDEVFEILKRSLAVVETGYNLLRRKATEVMVWILTNKNRFQIRDTMFNTCCLWTERLSFDF